jgi:hypothetical protein
MRGEDERDRVARNGTAAWKRLKTGKSWTDWIQVGEAVLIGREWAMSQAGTNKPEGKGYNTVFSEWLAKYKLDDMHNSDRSRLFSVMDNLPMIEEWRRTLTLTERMKLNHPNAVLRKWKSFIEPDKPKSGMPTLRDSVVDLSEENEALRVELASSKAHVAELEAARDGTPASSSGSKNPLVGLDAGQVVDLIKALKASTVRAIVHDLVKETGMPAKLTEEAKP